MIFVSDSVLCIVSPAHRVVGIVGFGQFFFVVSVCIVVERNRLIGVGDLCYLVQCIVAVGGECFLGISVGLQVFV